MNTIHIGGLAPWQKRRVTTLIELNLGRPLRVADFAQTCGLSVSHFARSFSITFGTSAHRWLVRRRIEFSQRLLIRTGEPLARIACRAGFPDQAAFTRTFHRTTGTSPGRWRRYQRFGRSGELEAPNDKSDAISQDAANGHF